MTPTAADTLVSPTHTMNSQAPAEEDRSSQYSLQSRTATDLGITSRRYQRDRCAPVGFDLTSHGAPTSLLIHIARYLYCIAWVSSLIWVSHTTA